MTPREASQALLDLCTYMGSGQPDKSKVKSEVRRIRDAVLVPKQAAQLGNFTRREFEAASNGLQALVDKVMKAAKTMNPQDPARRDLEQEASHLLSLKSELMEGFTNISKTNV